MPQVHPGHIPHAGNTLSRIKGGFFTVLSNRAVGVSSDHLCWPVPQDPPLPTWPQGRVCPAGAPAPELRHNSLMVKFTTGCLKPRWFLGRKQWNQTRSKTSCNVPSFRRAVSLSISCTLYDWLFYEHKIVQHSRHCKWPRTAKKNMAT